MNRRRPASRWLVLVPVLLALALLLAGIGVYYFVPVIQPCALLARVVPPQWLPPNPNIRDLSFQPLPGARALTGEYACSGYRIEVPNNWNGDLVLYAHGFRGAAPELTVTDLPVRDEAIRQGFAWAASTYRANGYNPLDGIQDTRLLVDQFEQKVGKPKQIFLYGSSMGGHVVIGSLEQFPDLYAGAVTECGAVGGAAQIDYLVAANALADELAGTNMFAPENRGLSAQLALLNDKVYPALGPAPNFQYDVDDLYGSNVPAPQINLTPKGLAFRDSTIYLGGGPRPFAQEGFAGAYELILYASRAMYALVPGLLSVGTNVNTRYQIDPGLGESAEQLNADVKRIAADPTERAKYTFTGKIKAPLLTIHDTGDAFVPISNEQALRQNMERAGYGGNLVQRAIRRFLHCDFSTQERNRAFNDLIGWVKQGTKPAGEDLMGSLLDAGKQFTDPLRTDDPGQP